MGLAAEVKNIVKALKTHHSNEEIAQILSCDVSSVEDYVKECDSLEAEAPSCSSSCSSKSSENSHSTSPENQSKLNSSGRPKVTSPQQDGLVEQLLSENGSYTASDIQRILEKQLGTLTISKRTIQRRIKQYKTRFATVVGTQNSPEMSAGVRQSRLQWALAHQQWTVEDWRNIFNMDDSKHELQDRIHIKDIYQDTLIGPIDSPDLNIMEQLMSIIAPMLDGHSPQTVHQFKSLLYDVWHSNENVVAAIENLYASMPQRIQAVIANDGGPISG